MTFELLRLSGSDQALSALSPKANIKAPTEIIEKLNREIDAVLADPTMKARFAELACTPKSMKSAEFGKLIVGETEK